MNRKEHPPSVSQILWTDYTAFYSALLPIMIWIIFISLVPAWRQDGPIIPQAYAPAFILFTVVVSSLSLILMFGRILQIRNLLLNGDQVIGRITNFKMPRDRGWVQYAYVYKRKPYQSSVSVHRNLKTKALKKGKRVLLRVDPNKPERAFIQEIYSQKS